MNNSILANEYVTDTVGLVLRIERRRVGPTAKRIFEAVEAGSTTVHIPALVFAEILYLSERRRIRVTLLSTTAYLQQFPRYQEYAMGLAVVQAASEITDVPELHDRLIGGVARLRGLELITNDVSLQSSTALKTVW
ncbi:MAG TPA: PIN domain-containing protein [Dehalococcoidia bacterium]|jgi:predicted nucleic acid-binding protein|nr:PIN domain-containing protein [Dehalococcoidia bacterium]